MSQMGSFRERTTPDVVDDKKRRKHSKKRTQDCSPTGKYSQVRDEPVNENEARLKRKHKSKRKRSRENETRVICDKSVENVRSKPTHRSKRRNHSRDRSVSSSSPISIDNHSLEEPLIKQEPLHFDEKVDRSRNFDNSRRPQILHQSPSERTRKTDSNQLDKDEENRTVRSRGHVVHSPDNERCVRDRSVETERSGRNRDSDVHRQTREEKRAAKECEGGDRGSSNYSRRRNDSPSSGPSDRRRERFSDRSSNKERFSGERRADQHRRAPPADNRHRAEKDSARWRERRRGTPSSDHQPADSTAGSQGRAGLPSLHEQVSSRDSDRLVPAVRSDRHAGRWAESGSPSGVRVKQEPNDQTDVIVSARTNSTAREHPADRMRVAGDEAHAKMDARERAEAAAADGGEGAAADQQGPDFALSGKLVEDTNTCNGVVVKYSEPPEARQPKRRWRLYVFRGDTDLPTLHIHRQSGFLMGRDRKVADIPIDHPSCSKQHAALQYRLTGYERADGSRGRRVRPYIMDLDSANGTYVNNKRIESRRYVELLERDVIKFGFSSREYVLLHEHSKDDDTDEDV